MTRTHSYDKLPFVLFEGDSEVGHTLGRYVLHDELACGGMGAVYLGRLDGPAGFSRTVAIKRLHPHLARDPEFAAMFLDEARLAARIAHPNVVPTLDVVQSADALLVVMEYVHGESLAVLSRAARKRGERLPMGVATSIVIDVLDGLHAAHEAKDACGKRLDIVHRDVSPHNVMVGRDGLARVVDFGVAKAASKIYASSPGQVRGKLAYMAPEQMLGEAIDRRADVFAASIVLWELLTGARLFDSAGVGAGAAAFGAVIDPPSMRVSAIPEALDAIVLRGLARDAGHRFATAHEMARALEEATLSARRAEVGEWVERTAGDALRLRASRIEHIGRAAAPPSRARQMSESAIATDPVALESHPQSARSDAEEEPTATEPSLNSARATRRSRAYAGIVALFVTAVAVPATWVAAKRGGHAQSLVPAAASVADSTTAAATMSLTATAATAPATHATVAAAGATTVTHAAGASLHAAPPPAAKPTLTRRRAQTSCDPPYEFLPDGTKRLKLECVQ